MQLLEYFYYNNLHIFSQNTSFVVSDKFSNSIFLKMKLQMNIQIQMNKSKNKDFFFFFTLSNHQLLSNIFYNFFLNFRLVKNCN